MMHVLKRAWSDFEMPSWLRPRRIQVAALCYRKTETGKQVLLITSRDTGRWIVPKGWPITGKNGAESALQEAWEEAGVREANIEAAPIGYYDYDKGLDGGETVPIETQVYLTRVTKLSPDYPEVKQRKREWVDPAEAAERVDEPDLKALLRTL